MAPIDYGAVSDIVWGIGKLLAVLVLMVGVGWVTYIITTRMHLFSYNYKVLWIDSKNPVRGGSDKAGIFVDQRTGYKRLYLKKANVGLDPDNVPWKLIGGSKYIFLLRDGLKNFRYLDLKFTPNPGYEIQVGEEDLNWAIAAYDRSKNMFAKDMLMQILPYIGLALVSVVIIIIFVQFFKRFDVLEGLGVSLKEAAIALREANSGTVVID